MNNFESEKLLATENHFSDESNIESDELNHDDLDSISGGNFIDYIKTDVRNYTKGFGEGMNNKDSHEDNIAYNIGYGAGTGIGHALDTLKGAFSFSFGK
jgi:translation initiation factor 2B subunit (eIF-2B alpha/beta/delta family)